MASNFSVIYCNNCKRVLGRYNRKYYTDDKIGEVIQSHHRSHVHEGHDIEIRVSRED